MICNKCGKENDEGVKFCSECGNPFISQEEKAIAETAPVEEATSETAPVEEATPKVEPIKAEPVATDNAKTADIEKKKKRKKIILIAVAVIVFLSICNALSCDHDYKEATCTKAKICKYCEKEKGSPLGHFWIDATCTEAQTCGRCKITEGESLGHEWVKATCTEPKTCSRCSETTGKALGHTGKTWKQTVKPTCKKEGEETGTCTRCKKEVTRAVKKTAHKTGDWQIITKATATEYGKRQKVCTACGEVVKKEEYKLSAAEYKSLCKTYSYNTIARNPNQYKGELGKFYGKVIQVMESEIFGLVSYTLRVALNGNYNNVILVVYVGGTDEAHILEDDYITLYGELQGTYTYETVMGNDVTIPYVDAQYLTIH